VKRLLCDTSVLIAIYDRSDQHHVRCIRLLNDWDGTLLIPEPVLGETCDFLRNHVRNGPALEVQLLESLTTAEGDIEVTNPLPDDRVRAADLARQLVSGPPGYVDGTILAMAERLKISDIATVDYKFLGMASPVSRLQPLRWVLQET
jgi:predicted nucleic acid-binding protein